MPLPVVPENATARQLGAALTEAADEIRRIRSLPEDQRSEDTVREARELRQFVLDVDVEHTARAAAERATYVPESNGPTAAFDQTEQRQRSLGEMVTADEGYQEFVKSRGAGHSAHEINLERTLMTEGGADSADLWIPKATPAAPVPQQRRLFLRSLLSQTNTTFPTLPYMQETNVATNEVGANVTAEGTAKNEVTLEWVQADAHIRKITAWIPMTTEIIEDAPALRGYIDNRLLYMLALREEIQFLNGSGTAPNMRGIRQTTGLQTQVAIVADIPATIALAIGKVENVDGEADGVAMNPLDFWEAVSTRHAAQFDNAGGGNAPSAVGSLSWGLPVVRTRGLERTAALVASWRLGATVLDRSGATIRVGNQHLDYFTTNKVAVVAEKRVGIAVDKPANFVETEISFEEAA